MSYTNADDLPDEVRQLLESDKPHRLGKEDRQAQLRADLGKLKSEAILFTDRAEEGPQPLTGWPGCSCIRSPFPTDTTGLELIEVKVRISPACPFHAPGYSKVTIRQAQEEA